MSSRDSTIMHAAVDGTTHRWWDSKSEIASLDPQVTTTQVARRTYVGVPRFRQLPRFFEMRNIIRHEETLNVWPA